MSSRYTHPVSVFSPYGHLLQVEYAQEAVRNGSIALGVCGANCVVLGVERKAVEILQVESNLSKIRPLDEHVMLTFAGLTADAHVMIYRAQVDCQFHRLDLEDPVSLEYITRFIAQIKHKYTQTHGRRPFGISCLITGFDEDGTPRLYETQPSGNYIGWTANAIGRSASTVRGYLERNYKDETVCEEKQTVKLAIEALLKGAQNGHKNLEIAVMKRFEPMRMLDRKTIEEYVSVIEKEKQEALTST